MDKGEDWRALELDEQGRVKREEAPLTITGLLREAAQRPPATSSALSLVLDQHELADAEIPVTVKDSETLMKAAPKPDFEGLAAQERAARPELQAMTREPRIAKAMDEAFAASRYGGNTKYHGENGFYITQDSSGRYFPQSYEIEGFVEAPSGIETRVSHPYGNMWHNIENFLLNRKPVAEFHAHPNGEGWQSGVNGDDLKFGQKMGLPIIVKAPDGVHYGGVQKPDRPAPYHGLFNWF